MQVVLLPRIAVTLNHQGRTLDVSWLPGNPPQHSEGGGAHRKSASTAPTNNPRVAARYYNQQCMKRLSSFGSCLKLSLARSQQLAIVNQPEPLPSLQFNLYHVPTANMGGVSYIMGVVLIFAMRNARRNGQEPPCVNSGYAPDYIHYGLCMAAHIIAHAYWVTYMTMYTYCIRLVTTFYALGETLLHRIS